MKRVTQTVRQESVTRVIGIATHTCDWCSKQVSDNGETIIGGAHNGGWYHLLRTPRSTALYELKKARQWDFCGFECLNMWVNDGSPNKHE